MKKKLKLILVLLVGAALTYTACKKDSSSVPQSLPVKSVVNQVALNLAQTLYGGFGAFNVTGGLNAPNTLGVSRQKLALKLNKGRQLNDLGGDITCGMSIDTTFSGSFSVGDTTISLSGPIKFTFLCTAGVPSGFTVNETLNVSESTPNISDVFMLGENLTLQAVSPTDPNSNVTFGGTSDFSSTIKYKTGAGQNGSATFDYNFTSVIIDSNGDIVSGSATFSTKGSNSSGTWNYQGTITFLGNNMVKVVINGTTYNVNLETGVVS